MRIAILITALAALSCGRSKSKGVDGGGPSQDASSRFVSYPLKMSEIHFGLRAASEFSMTVEGCSSGYTSTVTQASASILVYKFDQNCLAKLNSVTVDGVTYQPSTDDGFETWQAGDIARFDDTAGSGRSLKFQVINQLDNPIPGSAPTHGVDYAYSSIEQGADQDCTGDCISNSSTVSVNGMDAPAFDVNAFTYVDMAADGAGKFQFKLECQSDLVGSGGDASCKSAPLSGLRYKLVKDTFGGVLTATQAAEILQDNPDVVDASEVIDASVDAAMVKGGFITKVLQGPALIHLNPEMIFVLETGGTSFKYWNVDVTPIVQTK